MVPSFCATLAEADPQRRVGRLGQRCYTKLKDKIEQRQGPTDIKTLTTK